MTVAVTPTPQERARARAAAHHKKNRTARLARMRARYLEQLQAERERHRIKSRSDAGRASQKKWRETNRAKEVRRNLAYRRTLNGRTRTLIHSARRNAVACAVPFSIVIADVLPLLASALKDGTVSLESGRHDTASLDRIEPCLGYVPGNIQVIPWWLNAAYNRFPKAAVNDAILQMAARLAR